MAPRRLNGLQRRLLGLVAEVDVVRRPPPRLAAARLLFRKALALLPGHLDVKRKGVRRAPL